MYKTMVSLKLILLILLSGFSTIVIYFQVQINKLEQNKQILGRNLHQCYYLAIRTYLCIKNPHDWLFQSNLKEESRIAQIQSESQLLFKSQTAESAHLNTKINAVDNLVVIYNRVPKTGSTSFVGIPYDLCKKNKFHVLHINITANMHVLSLPNQYKFVQNVTHWNAMKPALYHGHLAFLDFTRLGASEQPTYINIIRKPLDRLISYYYFLRYGDDFRPYLVRRKHGNKMSFDECVQKKQADCDPNNMWLQIPFFCGHAYECWIPGNEWALNEAKKNLINHYLLVGVTEELEDFVAILEATLPRIFKGATEHFLKSNKTHLRKTAQKILPSNKTVDEIKQSPVWKMENELYEFALEQFHFVKRRVLQNGGEKIANTQKYIYEKIRPK